MPPRTNPARLFVSLVAFFVLMVLLLTAIGAMVGTVELVIWLVLVAVGFWWIVRQHRRPRSERHGAD